MSRSTACEMRPLRIESRISASAGEKMSRPSQREKREAEERGRTATQPRILDVGLGQQAAIDDVAVLVLVLAACAIEERDALAVRSRRRTARTTRLAVRARLGRRLDALHRLAQRSTTLDRCRTLARTRIRGGLVGEGEVARERLGRVDVAPAAQVLEDELLELARREGPQRRQRCARDRLGPRGARGCGARRRRRGRVGGGRGERGRDGRRGLDGVGWGSVEVCCWAHELLAGPWCARGHVGEGARTSGAVRRGGARVEMARLRGPSGCLSEVVSSTASLTGSRVRCSRSEASLRLEPGAASRRGEPAPRVSLRTVRC